MPPETPFQKRGSKTFWMLVLFNCFPVLFLLCALVVLALLEPTLRPSIASFAGDSAPVLERLYGLTVAFGFLALPFIALFCLFLAWLDYINIRYYMDSHSFKIRLGIFNINEMSILYRQIQNVNIDRPLLFRLLGMSRIVILTSGHEDVDKPERDETEGIIDLIDKEQAIMLQHELLNRSHVQTIVHVSAPQTSEDEAASTAPRTN